jgi:hypothetical protein
VSPTLRLFYIDDLADILRNYDIPFTLFADDVALISQDRDP